MNLRPTASWIPPVPPFARAGLPLVGAYPLIEKTVGDPERYTGLRRVSTAATVHGSLHHRWKTSRYEP